jgi:hypothetical protein
VASLSLKAQVLRDELRTWEGLRSTQPGKIGSQELGSWVNVARYLAPDIILRLTANGKGLVWINVPGHGTISPQLKAVDAWAETLPHSDGETVTDAITSLRRSISTLSPEAEKNAMRLLSALERLLRVR